MTQMTVWKRFQQLFFEIDVATLNILGLGLLSGVLAAIVAANAFANLRIHRLSIGAGAVQGESYIISTALSKVIERHYPRIRLSVKETGGTAENLKLLEEKDIDLATAQADLPTGPSARLIAELYSDKFQLVVRPDSGIEDFSQLRGRRIALPQSGGQFQSFLFVAEHFGLTAGDFQFIGANETESNQAFLTGQADAAFRVRAASNLGMRDLAQKGNVVFLPINQAAAMKIKYPAFQPSTIPQGTYQGSPPIPSVDLPTVQVHRTLLVHNRVEKSVVYAIAQVLTDYRQEIIEAIPPEQATVRPLVAEFRAPTGAGLGVPVHPGAQAFYDRDQPSFLLEYADFVGLVLTVVLLFGSWLVQLRGIVEARQKNQADAYSSKAIVLLDQAQASQHLHELEQIRQDLLNLLTESVRSLDKDLISEDSFQSFRVVWQIALDVTRERQSSLLKQQRALKTA